MGKAEVGGKCRAVRLTSVSGKVMTLCLLETLLRPAENKEVIGNGEHGFSGGKWPFLAVLVVFLGVGLRRTGG